jgi:hypothetical protein
VLVLVSYCNAFLDFANGRPATRLRKGGYLFGGIAYACLCGNVGPATYGPGLDTRFDQLLNSIHSKNMIVESDADDEDTSLGEGIILLLPNFDFVPAVIAVHFHRVCHLATSVAISIVCYWSLFAYTRFSGITDSMST